MLRERNDEFVKSLTAGRTPVPSGRSAAECQRAGEQIREILITPGTCVIDIRIGAELIVAQIKIALSIGHLLINFSEFVYPPSSTNKVYCTKATIYLL